jgi:hypothetical protein
VCTGKFRSARKATFVLEQVVVHVGGQIEIPQPPVELRDRTRVEVLRGQEHPPHLEEMPVHLLEDGLQAVESLGKALVPRQEVLDAERRVRLLVAVLGEPPRRDLGRPPAARGPPRRRRASP